MNYYKNLKTQEFKLREKNKKLLEKLGYSLVSSLGGNCFVYRAKRKGKKVTLKMDNPFNVHGFQTKNEIRILSRVKEVRGDNVDLFRRVIGCGYLSGVAQIIDFYEKIEVKGYVEDVSILVKNYICGETSMNMRLNKRQFAYLERTISELHESGIFRLDLHNRGNVIIEDYTGLPKLIDLGIAGMNEDICVPEFSSSIDLKDLKSYRPLDGKV
jgi:serine/threonine protein kinase